MKSRARRYRYKVKVNKLLDAMSLRSNRLMDKLGLKSKWPHLLLAFFLALLCWYTVAGREHVERWIEIPVQYSSMPPSLIIQDGSIQKLSIHLRGPKGILNSIEPQELTYSVNAKEFTAGQQEIFFNQDRISVPPAVQIMSLTPTQIDLTLDLLTSKDNVPVTLALPGHIKNSKELVVSEIEPKEVNITGPKSVLDSINSVKTQTIPYTPNEEGFIDATVDLDLPAKVSAAPSSVNLHLQLPIKNKALWFTVPLILHPVPGFQITPAQDSVKLLIRGPDYLVDNEEYMLANISAAIALPEKIQLGNRQFNYNISLPNNCTLVQSSPTRIKVKVEQERTP